MLRNLLDTADSGRLLMKMDDRCRWCWKLPAALAHLPNRNHRDLVQLCGLWCFLFHTLAHRNFWAFWQRFSWRCDFLFWIQIFKRWVFFHVFHDCVDGVFSHRGFLVPDTWHGLIDHGKVKRAAFFLFLLATSPGITWTTWWGIFLHLPWQTFSA